MTRRDLEERVHGMNWPVISPDLRARIMEDAPGHEQRIAWIDRLWFSRAWRVSMGASMIVVVLIGQWAAARPEPSVPRASVVADAERLETLVEQSGIPAADAALLVRRAMDRRTSSSPSPLVVDFFSEEGARQ